MRASRLFVLLLAALAPLRAADDPALPDGLYAEFTTPRGAFVCELLAARAPLPVTDFVGLAEGTLGPKKGTPYYTGLKWYRVVPGFVIQSGNPLAPVDGDAGYTFPDEFAPGLRHGEAGILSLANGGPDTNSAEFFITLGDCTPLNYLHSAFGRVVRGLEVLASIKQDDACAIKILRVGAAAQGFKADEAAFQALVAQTVKYRGATEPGPAANFDDPAQVLPTSVPRAQNFNFKLANFQRATGRRICARIYPTFAPASEKETPASFTQQLARTLGLDQDGVLAVYFAGQDQWYVWIGKDLMPVFNPEKQRTMDMKNALYQAVKARAAGYAGRARQVRGPDNPLTPADLAKYSVDAMLDALILQFEPRPKS